MVEDLRLAASMGFLLVPVEGLWPAAIVTRGLVRYDQGADPRVRHGLILYGIRQLGAQKKSA